MKVSLDGGSTWIDAPCGVKVDVEIPELGNEETPPPSIVFNFKQDGFVQDAYNRDGVCVSTYIATYEDIFSL